MTTPFSPKSGTTDVARLQQQVEEMNQRLRLLESALKVTPAEVKLTTPSGILKIEGTSEVLLKANAALRLQGPTIHLN